MVERFCVVRAAAIMLVFSNQQVINASIAILLPEYFRLLLLARVFARMIARNFPSERHKRFSIRFIYLVAVQFFNQIRSNFACARYSFISTKTINFGVISGSEYFRNAYTAPSSWTRVLMVFQKCVRACVRLFNNRLRISHKPRD